MHLTSVQTSDELNKKAHPLFSMGGKRHFEEKNCKPTLYRPHMHIVDKPAKNWTDKTM